MDNTSILFLQIFFSVTTVSRRHIRCVVLIKIKAKSKISVVQVRRPELGRYQVYFYASGLHLFPVAGHCFRGAIIPIHFSAAGIVFTLSVFGKSLLQRQHYNRVGVVKLWRCVIERVDFEGGSGLM